MDQIDHATGLAVPVLSLKSDATDALSNHESGDGLTDKVRAVVESM